MAEAGVAAASLFGADRRLCSADVLSPPRGSGKDRCGGAQLPRRALVSLFSGHLRPPLDKSSVSCVKLLIEAGANVCGVSDCYAPLVTAAEKGLTEAIKCLVEAGANPTVFDMFGRLPIELAAEYGTREDVEILFPFTSPVSTVANWSVDGIISHVKMEIKQLEDDNFVKKRMSELKLQADEAFKKQDYINASVLYTQKRSPAPW